MAVSINVLNAGNMTLTTGPATRAVTRVWWSNDESDYSDYPSNDGTFDSSCFTDGKYNYMAVKAEFGSDVTIIDEMVFQMSEMVTSVTIPNTVREIGDFAFSGCVQLTSLTLPNVMSIG
jgi:hypothetical protein